MNLVVPVVTIFTIVQLYYGIGDLVPPVLRRLAYQFTDSVLAVLVVEMVQPLHCHGI